MMWLESDKNRLADLLRKQQTTTLTGGEKQEVQSLLEKKSGVRKYWW